MILRFLFYLFVFYLLYKLIFHFILPVYRTTRQVKKGFREMSERMRQQQAANEGFGQQTVAGQKNPPGKNDKGDYIEFEEVKD